MVPDGPPDCMASINRVFVWRMDNFSRSDAYSEATKDGMSYKQDCLSYNAIACSISFFF